MLIVLLIFVYVHTTSLKHMGKSNVQESSAVTIETNLKNPVSKKYLVFFTDLLTLNVNINNQRQIKRTGLCSCNLNCNQLHITIPFMVNFK